MKTMQKTFTLTTEVRQEKTYELYAYFKVAPESSFCREMYFKMCKNDTFLRVDPVLGIEILNTIAMGIVLQKSASIQEISKAEYEKEFDKIIKYYNNLKNK